MTYNFDEVIQRRGTGSAKWDCSENRMRMLGRTRPFGPRTIPLFLADMDFACPPPVLRAVAAVADQRILGYTSVDRLPAYHQAVRRWFSCRYGWEIREEGILYTSGTVQAIGAAVRACTAPGDGVVVMRPVYGPFFEAVTANGRRVVDCPLREADGVYTMDFARLETLLRDPRTTLVLLCSPHNPVGRVWTREELERLGALCARGGAALVSDEVHCDIRRAGVVHTPAPLAVRDCPVITLTSPNKTFNLAGVQCGNAIISDEALRRKFRAALGHCMPTPFAPAALIAAYTQCDDWWRQMNSYVDGTIDLALELIRRRMPRVRCQRPEGTYLLWLDLRGLGLSAAEVHRRIYDTADVILENGAGFDPAGGALFERLCVPAPRARVLEALERIAGALEESS